MTSFSAKNVVLWYSIRIVGIVLIVHPLVVVKWSTKAVGTCVERVGTIGFVLLCGLLS